MNGTCTYGQAVDLITHFIRDQNINDNFPDGGIVGKLFHAMKNGLGDFSDEKRSAFPKHDNPITESIWWEKGTEAKKTPEEPSIFSFENGISALGTLAWALPEGGAFASAGVSLVKDLIENTEKRLAWAVKLSQVTNPPANPYDEIVSQVCDKIDDVDVRNDITSVFVEINTIQAMLNQVLLNPKDVTAARTGAIRTDGALDKGYVLGDRGLGATFRLLDSRQWGSLINADQAWIKHPITKSLLSNPEYSDLTLTALAHAATTVVNGLLAYVFLYPLPQEAFSPGWDRKITNAKKARIPYVPKDALRATAGTTPPTNYPHTAWTALNILESLLDPGSTTPNIATRLAKADAVWQKIFDRLWNYIGFGSFVGRRRSGSSSAEGGDSGQWMWFRPEDATKMIKVTTDMALGALGGVRKWDYVTGMRINQIACFDDSLNLEGYDAFLEPYRHFHTTLKLAWIDSGDADSIAKDVASFGATGVATAVRIKELNDSFSSFTYPLVAGGDKHGTGLTYNDVFWLLPDGQDGAEFPDKPGFLSTSAGRDLCAYIGFVLNTYMEAYQYKIDMKTGVNLLTFTNALSTTFRGYHTLVHTTTHDGD